MRLLVTDLDGTIADPDGVITPRTLAAFDSWRAAGNLITFATGRSPRLLYPLPTHLLARGLMVCCNGAVIYDAVAQAPYTVWGFSESQAGSLLDTISRALPNRPVRVETASDVYVNATFAQGMRANPARVVVDDFVGAIQALAEVVKLSVRCVDFDEARDAEEILANELRGVAVVSRGSVRFPILDIVQDGIDKSTALAHLANDLGIARQNVVAFGDMTNDLGMLNWAGCGYALASGDPDTVRNAPLIAPRFEEDGVAVIVEELLRGGPARL